MSTATARISAASHAGEHSPSYQAFRILHLGFTVAPILAGLDKFFHLLVNWDQYVPAFVNGLTGGRVHELMFAVGVIEVVAGIGVALRPRLFSYVVAAWLWVIILNLLLIPGYFDIALRDFGLSLGALALGRLSAEFNRQ
jgi:hypothetical protein